MVYTSKVWHDDNTVKYGVQAHPGANAHPLFWAHSPAKGAFKFSWGKRPPLALQALRRTKRAWWHLTFCHVGSQNRVLFILG